MRKIYTKTFVYFAEIQYIYNEINNRNIIMDILNFTYYFLTYIIHSGFISGYQNRYGDNLKPPTNVYHRMTA